MTSLVLFLNQTCNYDHYQTLIWQQLSRIIQHLGFFVIPPLLFSIWRNFLISTFWIEKFNVYLRYVWQIMIIKPKDPSNKATNATPRTAAWKINSCTFMELVINHNIFHKSAFLRLREALKKTHNILWHCCIF